MRQVNLSLEAIDLSINHFTSLVNFNKLFTNIKKALEKDQKDLVFNRKNKKEEDEYFNFMKTIFTSPDKVG